MRREPWLAAGMLLALLGLLAAAGCGEEAASGDAPRRTGGPGRGGPPGRFGGMPGGAAAAVPVEVAPVERRSISAYIETNGTLEAENEVDIVTRATAPIVELLAEEGDRVRAGQVVARLDDTEFRAQLEIARVAVDDTRQVYDRARNLSDKSLISAEEYERAAAGYESAVAQFEASRIQLGYTEIKAPFDGLIVTRYVDAAEQVSANQPLYRISDFDPLLCPIQVPERELPRLHLGQPAWLEVESWPDERFAARVLRISPVVDAATGTIKVTLEATQPRRLRPGMFARVFLEAETREDALVIPKAALSLESIGDTVYVARDGAAARREVELGFEEEEFVEVRSGVAEGEQVVVVGQDGLSDGTAIQVLGANGAAAPPAASGRSPAAGAPGGEMAAADAAGPAGGFGPPGGRGGFDPANVTPEMLERMKQRMRARGMTDEQIEQRLERFRQRSAEAGEAPAAGEEQPPAGNKQDGEQR